MVSRSKAFIAGLALVAGCWGGVAQEGGEFSIRQSSIVSASGQIAGGNLSATGVAGLPAVGSLSGGEFEMTAGIVFDPPAPPGNLIFRSGFEAP